MYRHTEENIGPNRGIYDPKKYDTSERHYSESDECGYIHHVDRAGGPDEWMQRAFDVVGCPPRAATVNHFEDDTVIVSIHGLCRVIFRDGKKTEVTRLVVETFMLDGHNLISVSEARSRHVSGDAMLLCDSLEGRYWERVPFDGPRTRVTVCECDHGHRWVDADDCPVCGGPWV